ncbi:Ribonuclease H-like domain containing protein [Naviculisporaceae sp. PSN 640]
MTFSLFARADPATEHLPEQRPRRTWSKQSRRLRLLGVPPDRLDHWEAVTELMPPMLVPGKCGGQFPIKCETQTQIGTESRLKTTNPEDDPKNNRVGLYGFIQGRCDDCGPYRCEPTALVIHVDGACPYNGTPGATRSSYGVFFGDSGTAATWNISNEVRCPRGTHTYQQAVLYGAIAALEASNLEWPRVKQVIIRSDSLYLVDGITEHIHKWQRNGWKTASREPVANKHRWKVLLKLIAEVKDLGAMHVAFHWIPREQNQDAHNLAAAALE